MIVWGLLVWLAGCLLFVIGGAWWLIRDGRRRERQIAEAERRNEERAAALSEFPALDTFRRMGR